MRLAKLSAVPYPYNKQISKDHRLMFLVLSCLCRQFITDLVLISVLPVTFLAHVYVESLNNYFRSAVVTDNHQPATTFNSLDLDAAVEFPFRFSTIDRSRVLFLLKNLDEKVSGARWSLSRFSDEIVDPLTKLFNKSLQTGVFPNEWKRCNVTPVHKGGASDIPGNHRPISVVPVVAKVLEKMWYTSGQCPRPSIIFGIC